MLTDGWPTVRSPFIKSTIDEGGYVTHTYLAIDISNDSLPSSAPSMHKALIVKIQICQTIDVATLAMHIQLS